MDKSEKRFESDIESFLISDAGGYEQFSYLNPDGHRIQKYVYDKEKAIYPEVLVNFVARSQPKAWARYQKYYGEDAPEKLYRRFETSVQENGLVHVLKYGIEDMGIKLKVCYFKPESDLNEEQNELYKQNILGCTRQFAYSKTNHNTMDMVLSVNGIPVVALELKNQFMGQDVDCAIEQFKNDRDPKEFCFRLNHRFLVYFAVDLFEVYMTTCLAGGGTRFMPFNQGSNGAGAKEGRPRCIVLTVREEQGRVAVRLENSKREEPLALRDGMPVTEKKDSARHGYGMLSMRQICESYGGIFLFKDEGKVFRLEFFFRKR